MSTLQNLSVEAQREAHRRAHDEVWRRQQERLRLNRELLEAVRRDRAALRTDAAAADDAARAHAGEAAALQALHDQLALAEQTWERTRHGLEARLDETGDRARAAAEAADALAEAVRAGARALERIEQGLRDTLGHDTDDSRRPVPAADARAKLDRAAQLGAEAGLLVRDARLLVPTALTMLAMEANDYTLGEIVTRDGLVAYFVSADRTHQVAVRHQREADDDLAFRLEVETFEQQGEACLDVLEDFVVGVEETSLAAVAWAAPRRYPKRDGESGIPVPVRITGAPQRHPDATEPRERG